ncbi:general transcription factor 3C polypeptide 3-like [Clavelina lepadiformis]|uniref:general transcription factor 3C polypeptide 3-like n=1 Tax=Clavelina lepadiformis TaxID=159417 RepID=UPI0040416048
MWNSDEFLHEDPSVSNMSSSLNIPPDYLQQFMRGESSLESLAQLRPASYNTGHGDDQVMISTTSSWLPLQSPDIFSCTTSYAGSSLESVISSPSTATPINDSAAHSHSTLIKQKDEETMFRSPPLPSSSLMELSTVTPTRIRKSPTHIITKHIPRRLSSLEQENTLSENPQTFIRETSLLSYEDTAMAEFPAILHHDEQANGSGDSANRYGMVTRGFDSDFPSTSAIFMAASTPSQVTHTSITETNILDNNFVNVDPTEDEDDNDEEDQMIVDKIQQDLDIELVKETRKQANKGSATKLPKEVRGLMGEANLCYARGDHEDAIKMCMEVIRLAPYAGEPFETLAMIYDEQGQTERSLQYSLLAAHLSKTDAAQWMHLAEMCKNQGDDAKALNCYSKASRQRPQDHSIVIECAKLQQKIGGFNKAMALYKSAISLAPSDDGERAVQLARTLSKECHRGKANRLGINLLEEAFKTHRKYFADEDANMLCELYLLQNELDAVIKLLMDHCQLEVKLEDQCSSFDFERIMKISIPASMPVDLSCKVAVAGIASKKQELVKDIVANICQHDPSNVGDLQFEIAETYMAIDDFSKALLILDKLVRSEDLSLAAVWLRHAECHSKLGNIKSALSSYKQCVELAPGHFAAQLAYSEMLRKEQKFVEAIHTLDVAENYEIDPKEHMKLHTERYRVLKMWGDKSDAFREKLALAADTALMMFANKCQNAFKEGKFYVLAREVVSSNPMAGNLKIIRKLDIFNQSDEVESLILKGDTSIYENEHWLEFFNETVALLVRCRRFRDAVNLGEVALLVSKWYDHIPTRRQLECVVFSICMISGHYQKAYIYIRSWIHNKLQLNEECNYIWNIFSQLIAKTGDHRHQKFCMRLLLKHPDNHPLIVLNGHNFLVSGVYKTALREYLCVHRKFPNEPLYLMMLGIAFINIASQKYTQYKHSIIAQSLACFHKYLKARKFPQECYYNIGRAMHQIGLEHYAIHYYEKALEAPVAEFESTANPDCSFDLDLRREIGFNMSLIYRKSGNIALANETLARYCVV